MSTITKLNNLKTSSDYGRNYIEANPKYDAMTRWKNKKVIEAITLFDGFNTNFLKTNLPFEKVDNGILIRTNTDCKLREYRNTVRFNLTLNNLDLTNFNRIRLKVRINAIGHRNFYTHLSLYSEGLPYTNASSIKTNCDEEILFELANVKKDQVSSIAFDVFLMGTPIDALPYIEIILQSIIIEKVEIDYSLGFEAPSIAYSHIGYLPNAKKEAIISNVKATSFKLFNSSNTLVLESDLKEINNELGNFKIADFSSIKEEGDYYLKIGKFKTEEFPISKNIYESSLLKSLHFLKGLRCGEHIDGVHAECHKNVMCVNHDGKMVNVSGGWHDAGDVSQFEICTAEITTSLLDLIPSFKNDPLMVKRIKEEAKVGVNWLLNTTFHDGNRTLAVLYNIWRNNVLEKNDVTIYDNKSENGPFENLLSATALLTASLYYKEDKVYNDWLIRVGLEDFEFALKGLNEGLYSKRWGKTITSVTSAEVVKAALLLHQILGEDKYLRIAEKHADIIVECQESISVGKERIRGFFYEDEDHEYVLTYEHRGHEQNPIQALTLIIKYYKKLKLENNSSFMFWMDAVELYKEYILKTINYTEPYYLIPNHIYNINKINMERFTVPVKEMEQAHQYLIDCIKEGKQINDEWYVRIFPVTYTRRGFLATHLSKVKALSSIYSLTKESKLKQIVVNQLEWMFGKNPFSTSFMYGEGYNYHPLYVAFTDQIVGALPVGVETFGKYDLPYWPQKTQAVFKEIWGHTTSKYLFILSDIL